MIDTIIACATCAKNFRGNGDAAGWSILFMLGVIVPMLVGVVFCMVRLVRRESNSLDPDLQDDYQVESPSKSR